MGVQDCRQAQLVVGRARAGNPREFMRQALKEHCRPQEFHRLPTARSTCAATDPAERQSPAGFVSIVSPGGAIKAAANESGRREACGLAHVETEPSRGALIANRTWHLAIGWLVPTVDNLGNSGLKRQPALIDYCSVRFEVIDRRHDARPEIASAGAVAITRAARGSVST